MLKTVSRCRPAVVQGVELCKLLFKPFIRGSGVQCSQGRVSKASTGGRPAVISGYQVVRAGMRSFQVTLAH